MRFEKMIDQIICGDAIEIMQQIPDGSIDLSIPDPPYNVGRNIIGDDKTEDEYLNDVRKWLMELRRVLKPNGSIYFFCSHIYMGRIDCLMQDIGFIMRNRIIWVKQSGSRATGRGYTPEYEPILYGVKGKEFTFNPDKIRVAYSGTTKNRKWSMNKKKGYLWKPNPLGKSCPDVWFIGQIHYAHPERIKEISTQKPEKLIKRIILASSNKGNIILDPFIGSGTTAVVCKKSNRHFIGSDISPKNVEIANKRLANIPERLDKF